MNEKRADIFDDSFLSTDDIAVLEGMLCEVDGRRDGLALNILNRAFDLSGHHWEMRAIQAQWWKRKGNPASVLYEAGSRKRDQLFQMRIDGRSMQLLSSTSQSRHVEHAWLH